jgi:hypothetical protein
MDGLLPESEKASKQVLHPGSSYSRVHWASWFGVIIACTLDWSAGAWGPCPCRVVLFDATASQAESLLTPAEPANQHSLSQREGKNGERIGRR